jgi:heat shock protein HslJ
VPAPAAALADSELFGRWRIVSLNGAPPLPGIGRTDGRDRPYLVFGPGSYGGNTGCNSFGGYGVLLGDRFYASGAMQTAIGCDTLMAQEQAITSGLRLSPTVTLAPDGRLTLTSRGGGSMVLERDTAAPAPLPYVPALALLAGTSWAVGGIDGEWLNNQGGLTLAFEADRWTLTGPCGTRWGGWRQSGDHVEPVGAAVAQAKPCPAAAAAHDAALAALLASPTRFTTGPNGEILIGGGGHWLTGERPRADLTDNAPLLAGTWRIAEIDGAPPASGTEPGISFGRAGYSGGTGCNSFQGHYLAHRRRVFTGMTMQTEMGCGALTAQERRIIGLLDGAPAIARAGENEIALVDATGRLLLRRAAPAGWAPEGRLWNGEPLTAELTMLDGKSLRERYADPETRLRLSAQRFDIDTGCGHLGGIWRRRGPGFEFLTDAEEPPKGACGGALVERLQTFMRFMNGQARILIGPSGELIIASEEHWLTGRVLRPSPKRR